MVEKSIIILDFNRFNFHVIEVPRGPHWQEVTVGGVTQAREAVLWSLGQNSSLGTKHPTPPLTDENTPVCVIAQGWVTGLLLGCRLVRKEVTEGSWRWREWADGSVCNRKDQ